MKFRDLLRLPVNEAGIIDAATLSRLLPDTPLDVIEQVYADHGRKHDFQAQYGALDLEALMWTKVARPASALIECGHFAEFSPWMHMVEQKVADFHTKGWTCVDVRRKVVEHWQTNQTWLRPPIFFDEHVMGNAGSLRLVEGHTRVGLLRGLVKAGLIGPSSMHVVWFGQ